MTPSEIAQAVKKGLRVPKFFPAEQAGGLGMIRALAAPYTTVRFMPTGGIGPENLREYLSFDRVLCCGGSWMVEKNWIREGNFDRIRTLTAEAVGLAAAARGKG